MSYSFESGDFVIKKEGLDLEKFKESLRNLCCSDFSGESGEDYFVEFEKDGEVLKMSSFDYIWSKSMNRGMSLSDIAKEILMSNYESDRDFYVDYNFNVLDKDDEIIVFAAAMSYS